MQSVGLVVLMAVLSVFMLTETSRNHVTTQSDYAILKAASVASNIIQYNDMMSQYIRLNYDSLHELIALTPGHIEQIKILDYQGLGINKYSQKQLQLFLNYHSIAFNFSKNEVGESVPMPLLYLATTWSGLIIRGYSVTNTNEIMGQLGNSLSKPLYQGNSSYWLIPWVFSQQNCIVDEIYLFNSRDVSSLNLFKNRFRDWCTEIMGMSNYQFDRYVFLLPIYDPAGIL